MSLKTPIIDGPVSILAHAFLRREQGEQEATRRLTAAVPGFQDSKIPGWPGLQFRTVRFPNPPLTALGTPRDRPLVQVSTPAWPGY
jgi:hypothetical protein